MVISQSAVQTVCVIAAIALVGSSCLRAQSPLPFSVISPQDGQLVHPGDTIQVVVQPASGVTLSFLQLLSPIQSVTLATNASIPISIPYDHMGRVILTIIAASSAGGGEIDRTIDIEPSSQPIALQVVPAIV